MKKVPGSCCCLNLHKYLVAKMYHRNGDFIISHGHFKPFRRQHFLPAYNPIPLEQLVSRNCFVKSSANRNQQVLRYPLKRNRHLLHNSGPKIFRSTLLLLQVEQNNRRNDEQLIEFVLGRNDSVKCGLDN